MTALSPKRFWADALVRAAATPGQSEEAAMAASAKRRLRADELPRKEGKGDKSRFPLTVSRPELMVGGSDREFRHLVHGLFGFLARHEKIRAGHAKVIGLAGIEYTVLISIAHLSTEGDVSVKRVADHLHLSGAFITSTVLRLVARGVVHKKVDQGDRRRVTLTVSAKGNALLERLAPSQRQVNDVEFGDLSREEFRFLIDIVDGLIASADRAVALQTYLQSRATQR
jgi:MarR family transcriptional regulator, organic hydroperoxide resistance regulator